MKAATAIGIVVAAAGILLGAIMEGTSPAAFINIPAIIIIFGGTARRDLGGGRHGDDEADPRPLQEGLHRPSPPDLGAVAWPRWSASPSAPARTACSRSRARSRPSTTRSPARACSSSSTAPTPTCCARSSRPRSTRCTPATRPAPRSSRRPAASRPTIGIIGTVMGLVHVLENLSPPTTLGPAISGAFIATLLGVGSANVVFLPVANRLKALSEEEVEERTLTARGHPRDPGRRQPARRRREAHELRPARPSARPPPRPRPTRGLQGAPARGRGGHSHGGRGRTTRRGGEEDGEHADERWLLTYADMITLLDGAVHGAVLDLVGEQVASSTTCRSRSRTPSPAACCPAASRSRRRAAPTTRPSPSSAPPESRAAAARRRQAADGTRSGAGSQASSEASFQKLKRRIDRYAAKPASAGKVRREVTADGLLIRLLTDNLLFDSRLGRRQARGAAAARAARRRCWPPTGPPADQVEGNTDNVPIRCGALPDNWELSTARARAHRRAPDRRSMRPPERLTAAGRGELEPIAAERHRRRAAPSTGASRSCCPAPGHGRLRRHDRARSPRPPPRPRRTSHEVQAQDHPPAPADHPRRRLQVRARQAGAGAQAKIAGEVYIMPKDFLINLADGKFVKLGVALVLKEGYPPRPAGRRPRGRGRAARGLRHAAPGGGGARHRHRHASRTPPRRDLVAARAATRSRSASSSGSTRHRRGGDGRPVHRRRRPVARRTPNDVRR